MLEVVLAITIALVIGGCAASPSPHIGVDHPASVFAEEGVVPPQSHVLTSGTIERAPPEPQSHDGRAHEGHHQ